MSQSEKRWIRLLLHGKVATRQDIRDAVGTFRAEGHQVEVRVTWEAGDMERLAQEATSEGVATVVAVGGDGSISQVVTGIFQAELSPEERRPALAIIPAGTANDFARSCGIPLDAPSALRLATSTRPTPIDVGRVGDRYWINVATGGFGPKITSETPEQLKKVLGGAAYFLMGLTQFPSLVPDTATFRGPLFEWSGSFPILAIGNGRQAGGGHVLCPDALLDDGFLEVRILPTIPNEEHGEFIHDLMHEGEAALAKRVLEARLQWVEIESETPIQINLDGEPMIQNVFRFEVVPQGLELHLPENSSLLSEKV